jgi:hypothetical protein
MEVWHDRLLSWALAEAVAERGSSAAELASWLRRDRRPRNPRIWKVLAYLSLDVLWLLCGKPAKVLTPSQRSHASRSPATQAIQTRPYGPAELSPGLKAEGRCPG